MTANKCEKIIFCKFFCCWDLLRLTFPFFALTFSQKCNYMQKHVFSIWWRSVLKLAQEIHKIRGKNENRCGSEAPLCSLIFVHVCKTLSHNNSTSILKYLNNSHSHTQVQIVCVASKREKVWFPLLVTWMDGLRLT